MAAYRLNALNLTNVSQAQMLFSLKVSANLLPTLGAEPILFRNFRPAEVQPGGDHEIILSYDTWRQSLGVEPLLNQVVGDIRPALWVFLAAISLVLLVACANVTNLLLARSTIRQREMALRTSLGASRSRLVRQLFTESLLLAVGGGAFGILLAYGGILLLTTLSPDTLPRIGDVAIDGRVLAYTAVVSVLTGIIFGLAPSLGVALVDVSQPLKGQRSTPTPKHSGLRSTLVVSEVALSLALLIGAGLMLKSFVRMERVDPGFRADKVLTVWTILSEAKYAPQKRAAFYQQEIGRASCR